MTDRIDTPPAADAELTAIADAVGAEERARILALADTVVAADSDDGRELIRALNAAGLVTNRFDWFAWSRDSRYRDGEHLDDASVPDAVRLITRFVRGDRFVEGLLDQLIDDGTLQLVVRRALG